MHAGDVHTAHEDGKFIQNREATLGRGQDQKGDGGLSGGVMLAPPPGASDTVLAVCEN